MASKKIQIIGGFPQANWEQTDATKSDYIQNKPIESTDMDIIVWMASENIVTPVASASGAVYTNNNKVLII